MTFNFTGATTAKVSPFSFSSTTSAPSTTTATGTGFTLGGIGKTSAPTARVPPLSGVSFGVATTTPAGGLTFGTGAASTVGTTGIAAPQPALGTATTTTQSGFGFGSGTAGTTGFGRAPTAAPNTGFSFGAIASTTKPAAPPSGFTFGATTTAGTTAGLGGPAPGFAFSTTTGAQAAPAPAFKGLGGVNPAEVSGTSGAAGTAAKSSDGKLGKETEIPNQVATTVEAFKKLLGEQKAIRDALSKHTDRPFLKVREDLNLMKAQLVEISNNTSRNSCQIKKLKADVGEENKNVLIARRTFETPPGLQFENTAPIIYFSRVLQDFESRLINYKQEIEKVEGLLATSDAHSGVPPQELYQTLKRLHDGFIVVASDLYSVHDAIRKLRSTYLKYRRLLGDTHNPFPEDRVAGGSGSEAGGSSPRPGGVLPAPTSDAQGDQLALDPQRLFNTWMGIGTVAPSGGQQGPGAGASAAPPTAHSLLQGALVAAAAGGAGGPGGPGLGTGGGQMAPRLGAGGTLGTGGTGFSFGSTLGSTSTTGSLNLFGTGTGVGAKTSTGTSGLNLFTSNPLATGGFQLQSPPVGKKKR